MSVNAVLTNSLINGFIKGNPGLHMLLIRKSAACSKWEPKNNKKKKMKLNGGKNIQTNQFPFSR